MADNRSAGEVFFCFDDWPLVVAHHPSSFSDATFDAYLRMLDRIVATGGPYAYVDVYPRGTLAPDMRLIRKFARWFEANRDKSRAACVASVSVVPSAAMRGTARFLQHITDMPVVFAATLPEAIAHCTAALRAHGLEVRGSEAPASLAE